MSRRLPRYPFVLLGAMTLLTFGGPIVIGYFLRGGASPRWPPDRPVEWAVLLGISGMVIALMMACLALALVNHKAMARASRGSVDPGEKRP
jgi:drug/metabolite transporter (DMT)-like permease